MIGSVASIGVGGFSRITSGGGVAARGACL